MPPHSSRPSGSRASITIALAVVLAAGALAGCSSPAFDPAAPCTADAKVAGAYPALEALIPRTFENRAPDRVDSGRNCSPTALGALVTHGVSELRFAGATWDLGSGGGVTIAVLEADTLEAGWVAEFYQAGAQAARNAETIERSTMTLPDATYATRIDTLNGESYQTVIVWPAGERVRVVLVASAIREVQTRAAHEVMVSKALAAAFPDVAVATPPSRSGEL